MVFADAESDDNPRCGLMPGQTSDHSLLPSSLYLSHTHMHEHTHLSTDQTRCVGAVSNSLKVIVATKIYNPDLIPYRLYLFIHSIYIYTVTQV